MTEVVPAEWMPEFEGQRPPFQPGHELSMRHGAYSPRKVDPLAAEIRKGVLADPHLAYLSEPRWAASVWAWARAEAQAQLATEYLIKAGGLGDLDEAEVRSVHLVLHRAEARAASERKALGLNPLAAAKIGRDKAAAAGDVAQLFAMLGRLEREGRLPEGLLEKVQAAAT